MRRIPNGKLEKQYRYLLLYICAWLIA